MTLYDDAEFAAINLLRIATDETPTQPRSGDMASVAQDMYGRHGSDGIHGLVAALARQYSSAMHTVASFRAMAVDDLIDEFERGKLEQIDDERQQP